MKKIHISIEVASGNTKRGSKGNRKHLLRLLGLCHGLGLRVRCCACVILCKTLPTIIREYCACVQAQASLSLICYFHWWILTFSVSYSCAHCQWHEKLHEETFLHARQCNRFFWGSPPLAAWYPEAYLWELFWNVWRPAGRKPEFSRFQDWECQLVPEPGQWFLCQPCRWSNLAGITAWQPFPICDIQSYREKEDFYWQ